MFNDATLLVVDDEDAICRGCQRILSPRGFRVETSNSAREGLNLAVERDYAAILLDMKMPQMDGIEFLEALRKKKPAVPVIIITGYPSISNAASAMRLGAIDYVTKPFTPGALTQAVQTLLRPHDFKEEGECTTASPSVQPWVPAAQELHFWNESWFQPVEGDAMRVGAMLTRSQGGTVEAVWPPRVGWFVYQGLPLAGATMTGQLHFTVPSPISGVVVAANEQLFDRPSALWDDPCGDGWIACVRPARFEGEAKNCKLRRVILANADKSSAGEQRARLTSLGCQVRIAGTVGEIGPALQEDPDCNVLVMDAASLGEQGPELAGRINVAVPSTRIVVVASATCEWEAAYREHRILYYAVEPFADNEIADIVDAAFRPRVPRLPQVEHRSASSEPISRICIANDDDKTVGLVAESGLLQRDVGLGWQLAQKLTAHPCSMEMVLANTSISTAIHQAASVCDRLVILVARDTGRLPGSLVREEFVPASEQRAGKATTLIVQPASSGSGPLEFDGRTTAALAKHIVDEMTSSW